MWKLRHALLILLLGLALGTLGLTACDDQGPAEEAGEEIDDTADDVGDEFDDAGDEMEDTFDD